MDRLMVTVSGVRGTIGSTLTPQVACEFGCAFGTMLGAGKTVVMGRDTRPSGPMIRAAVAAGLMATGVNVVDLGVATTPGTAMMTHRLKADGGVIITASHNPIEYNGIKFLQPNGVCLTAGEAEKLKAIRNSGKFNYVDAEHQGRESQNCRTHADHVDAVCAIVDVTGIAARRFKVVVDSINGAGCLVTPMLLGKLGCEVAHINAEPNGQFAHKPEPIEENLTSLCDAVKKHKAAVGFAQDPDADRLALVDENGKFIGEEYTLALCAAFALRHRKGKIATNLATSRMVDDIAAAAGCSVVRAPTGEANVVEAMFREGCFLAGEGNGGVIEPRVVAVRNSLVGMAYLLQQMAETGKTVSQLVAEIPSYVLVKTKFPCPVEAVSPILERSRKLFASRKDARFNDADGLRVDLAEGWIGVRASNTEPIMRIFAEARDNQIAEGLVAQVRKIADAVIAGK